MTYANQLTKCAQYGVTPTPCDSHSKVGISEAVRQGVRPVYGLRCQPTDTTSGWYLWAGEWSDEDDFFLPLHVDHLTKWCPEAIPYLLLPPGWRFVVTDGYEDVWNQPAAE
jgi:hypothetical protein